MILYHGSNVRISKVDLDFCRPNKDFGKGFYLTNIKEQAMKMSNRIVRLYGKSPQITAFELDDKIYDDKDVRTLTFDRPNKDWALFVLNNRNKAFADIQNILCNQDNKYDMVAGAIANDNLAYLFRTFSSGLIDIETLVRGLEYKELTNQYSFHTERALEYLKLLED